MMKNLLTGYKAEVINHLFQTLLITYLLLLLVEEIWKGIISNYLNLNYLLIIVMITGILDVFSEHKERMIKERTTNLDYLFVLALGVLGFFIIKLKTAELGWLSWVISIIAGILIILLSLLILEED